MARSLTLAVRALDKRSAAGTATDGIAPSAMSPSEQVVLAGRATEAVDVTATARAATAANEATVPVATAPEATVRGPIAPTSRSGPSRSACDPGALTATP